MSYVFKTDEALSQGLLRISQDQLNLAVRHLVEPANGDSASAIHEARKAFKKTRSLLRLARLSLGDDCFNRENSAVRDLARQFSRLRDADALREALAALPVENPDVKGAVLAVDERLKIKRSELGSALEGELAPRRRRVLAGISEIQGRLSKWQPLPDSGPALAKELRKAFRSAKKARKKAKQKSSTENLHHWRKAVKHCWYMSQLLAPAWSKLGAPPRKKLDFLAQMLGSDHDLALLELFLTRQVEPWPVSIAPLRAIMVDEQRRLQKHAFKLGKDLFRQKPRRAAKVLAAFWPPKVEQLETSKLGQKTNLRRAPSGETAANAVH